MYERREKPSGIEIVGYLGIVAYYIVRYLTDSDTYALLAIILTIMGMMLVYVLTFPKYHAQQVMSAGFSFLYCPVLLSYIYMTRNLTQGIFLVWLIFPHPGAAIRVRMQLVSCWENISWHRC